MTKEQFEEAEKLLKEINIKCKKLNDFLELQERYKSDKDKFKIIEEYLGKNSYTDSPYRQNIITRIIGMIECDLRDKHTKLIEEFDNL